MFFREHVPRVSQSSGRARRRNARSWSCERLSILRWYGPMILRFTRSIVASSSGGSSIVFDFAAFLPMRSSVWGGGQSRRRSARSTIS